MMTNNYKPFIGGVPLSVERLAKGLRALGHEVCIFAPEYEGEEEPERGRRNSVSLTQAKTFQWNGLSRYV